MSPFSLLEWAQQHLELGYCPVPTVRESRGAYVEWKPWQTKRPEFSDLCDWFDGHPDRNLALVTGAFHNLVIVDCDDEAALKFARLQFPPTPYRVKTRRGVHLYFRHPGPGIHVITKASVLGPKDKGHPALDLRGDGGMCTGLGSVHRSGFVYRLDDGAEMVPTADLPVWSNSWLPRVEPLRPPGVDRTLPAVERAERYLAKVKGAGKGGRNQHTFGVAAAVVRDFGLTFEQGWALMSGWNAMHNDPPLPEDELRTIVQSCLHSGKRPVGWRAAEALSGRSRPF